MKVKHDSPEWRVLNELDKFGASFEHLMASLGTDGTLDLVRSLCAEQLIRRNDLGHLEITPHGRHALSFANRQVGLRKMKPTTAAARKITNSQTREPYVAVELRPYTGRPGAMDAHQLPSLFGNTLHWRDGRKQEVT